MKQIIATTLSGLFIKSTPWKEAHKIWFERMVEETGDESFRQWIGKADYFEGVNLAMAKLMPDASKDERTREARKRFMQSVIDFVKDNKDELINTDIIEYFKSLKDRFMIALITTNVKDFIDKLLSAAGLDDFFDIVEASNLEEEDDKVSVFERFISKYGKPVVYFGGDRKELYDYCKQKSLFCVFANLERNKELNVRTAYNLEELKEIIQTL